MSAESNNEDPSTWPDSLDALLAAPQFHSLLLENDAVRVLDVRIPPGRTVPVHTHQWPSVLYVLSAGDFVRRDQTGKVLLDTRTTQFRDTPLRPTWSPPLPPHSVENVGPTEIHVLAVEIKRAS